MKKLVLVISIIIFFYSINTANSESEKFRDLSQNYFSQYLTFHPLLATKYGFHEYDDQFTVEISDDYTSRYSAFLNLVTQQLKEIDYNQLNEKEKISYQLLSYILKTDSEDLSQPFNLMAIDHYSTIPFFIKLASGAGIQPFKTVADYQKFLKRIDGICEWIDVAITKMREGRDQKIVLPKVIVQKTIQLIRSQINIPLAKTEFYKPIINFPDSFDEKTREELTAQYIEAIKNKLIFSFKKMNYFLSGDYLPIARESIGLCDLPGGKELYKECIKRYTTTELDPEVIHTLGVNEVARITNLMKELKADDEYGKNVFDLRNRTVSTFQRVFSTEELIEQYNQTREKVEEELEDFFGIKPQAGFIIKPVEDFEAGIVGAHYQQADPDGSRPGVFYITNLGIAKGGRIASESLFLHEAVPGHHFQISLQHENVNLPEFQKFYWNSGYGEGWALYVETLGEDLGLSDDNIQKRMKLDSELLRAVRLVVDTGIHYKGWTFRQALNYMVTNTKSSVDWCTMEIERYIVMPAQALSYKIGEQKILELRNKAEDQLGGDFEIVEFHDQILEEGCLPLDLLELKIDKWIKDKSDQ